MARVPGPLGMNGGYPHFDVDPGGRDRLPGPVGAWHFPVAVGEMTTESPPVPVPPPLAKAWFVVQPSFTMYKEYKRDETSHHVLSVEQSNSQDADNKDVHRFRVKLAEKRRLPKSWRDRSRGVPLLEHVKEWKWEIKFDPLEAVKAFKDPSNKSLPDKVSDCLVRAFSFSVSLSTGTIDVFGGLITTIDVGLDFSGNDLNFLDEWKKGKGQVDPRKVFLPLSATVKGHLPQLFQQFNYNPLGLDYKLKVKVGLGPAGWLAVYRAVAPALGAALSAPVLVPVGLFIGGTLELFNLMQKAEYAGKKQQILEEYARAYVHRVFPNTSNGGKTSGYLGNLTPANENPFKTAQAEAFKQADKDAQQIGGPHLAKLNEGPGYNYSALEAYRFVLIKQAEAEATDPELQAIEALHKKIRQQQLEKYK